MKKLLLLLALLAAPSTAFAQCNGIFPAQTVCGNPTAGATTPRAMSPSSFIGAAGGTNGQIQYNNAGTLGGFTAGQDCTINTATGVVNCTKLQNVPVTTTGAATNDVLYYDGSGWTHRAFASLITAFCTASPTSCYTIFGYLSPYWYGAVCDGVTSDQTAFANMLAAAANKIVQLPPATCILTAHINVLGNTTIAGAGRNTSILKMTGQDYFFRIENVSNITFRDFYFLGTDNYTTWAASPIGAFVMVMSTPQSNFTFRNLQLSNFNATYWILGQITAGTISNTTFDNLLITTTNTDIPTDPDPLNNTNYLLALSTPAAGAGAWVNTTVKNSQITQTGACFGIILFANHQQWVINNNRILNPGGTNFNSHCTNGLGALNAYGILIYDLYGDNHPPFGGLIANNYITNPIAAGIYIVGDGAQFTRAANSIQTLITGNVIENQTHADVLLARGAIAIGLSTDINVVGNYLYNNAIGINILGQSAGNVSVLGNHVTSVAGGSVGISLTSGANGSSNTDLRSVRGNFVSAQSTSILASSSTGARFNSLDISGNSIIAPVTGLGFTGQWLSGVANIANNDFSGAGTFATIGISAGTISLQNNTNLALTVAQLPAANAGSSVYVSNANPATACTAGGGGAWGIRQSGAWKCF